MQAVLRHSYKYLAVFIFALLWESASRLGLLDPMFIPSLSEVLATTWYMALEGNLIEHILISLQRAFLGFLTAAVLGIPLGLLMGGWFKKIRLVIGPLLEIFSQTNPFILFHIIVLILGIGEPTKITIIAWTCIWPIVFNTISGIQDMNVTILKAGRAFGLGRLQLFTKIVVPSVAPSIFTGLRLSAGYSLFMLVAAELMGSSSGLGYIIKNSEESYQIKNIFAAALVIALLGLFIDVFMQMIEKRFTGRVSGDLMNTEF